MQRSRRALLQRRAAAVGSEKKGGMSCERLSYKVSWSLSLVLLLWGIIFLLTLLISHGNGYGDELDVEASDSNWHDTDSNPHKIFDLSDLVAASGIISDHTIKCPVSDRKASCLSTGAPVTQKVKAIPSTSVSEEASNETIELDIDQGRETPLKTDRLSRVTPYGLDEFKSRAIAAKVKHISRQTNKVIHRLEPSGKEYNYASAKKGAKVLASNKEAKGAHNILDNDKDKYLRNPCSAEGKYVLIELSEETLVDTIELANFEHYSSNLKDFELYSSLTYPSDAWIKIGHFTAQNAKHAQRFSLAEPKWARYLKLNMLSHYGTEFYCTLSVVEVYGVDVVERMLEDLISIEKKHSELEEISTKLMSQEESTGQGDLYQDSMNEISNEQHGSSKESEAMKSTLPDSIIETRPPQVGRMPGDTVLKILLQKVQLLDLNFSVLEKYLEELNSRYSQIFKEFDDDLSKKDMLLARIRSEIEDLQNSENIFTKEIIELHSWRSSVSSQLEKLAKENTVLRSEFERARDNQVHMENRVLAAVFISFVFGGLAVAKLFVDTFFSVFRPQCRVEFCRTSSAYLLLLLSSGIIALIFVL